MIWNSWSFDFKGWGAPTGRWLGIGLCLVCVSLCGPLGVRLRAQQLPLAPPVAADESHESRLQRHGKDRLDMRAAEDASQTEKLELVRKSFERQRWDEGCQQLQSVLDAPQDSLVWGEDHVWRPASEVAVELIHRSPEAAQRAYDARSRVLAEHELQQANQAHDLSGVMRVSRRFLLTTAGQLASRELIDAAIDHGNADAVATQVRDLLRVDSPLLRDAVWRSQVVEVLQQAGHWRLVEQLSTTGEGTSPVASAMSSWDLDRFGVPEAPLVNWPTLAGSPTGYGVARTESPSRLPRWRHPLVSSPRVRRLLQEQALKFEDEGALGLSVLSTVGQGDILVTRTLANLTAINVQTGQTLWTSREWGPTSLEPEGDSPEKSQPLDTLDRQVEGMLSFRIRHRMTACGSLGTLSANSRMVFALASFAAEESALDETVRPGFDVSAEDQGRVYLMARDLRTGKVVWRAGGPEAEEPPGLPAAGVIFFGPPTPDGDELFAVGERDGDILLFCLEAETGLVRWEQLLAVAGRRLNEDDVRQNWAVQVAVRGSLAICPTTTGWLTAVDRVSRKLLWSARMVPPVATDPDSPESPSALDAPNREAGLDERWPPSQPILLRDRVIVAPFEFPDNSGHYPHLCCFDLNSGQPLWDTGKGRFLGVIGASTDFVFLFDRSTVKAVTKVSGAPAWECHIGDMIAGRPLLTSTGIVVPTQTGELVRVIPESGKIVEPTSLNKADPPEQRTDPLLRRDGPDELSLGNLISLGGRLISVSPLEMTAFEWQADEPRWQAQSLTDVPSAIRWAQTLALQGKFEKATQTLRAVAPLAAGDPALLARQQQALLSILRRQLEAESQEPGHAMVWHAPLEEAKSLATSNADREAVRRLEIDLAMHAEKWDAAWEEIKHALHAPLLLPVEVDQRIVSPEAWLADRILTLGRIPDRATSDALRGAIRTELQSLWNAANLDGAGRQRLLLQFAETPFTDPAELEALTGEADPLALTRLQALLRSRDRLTAQRASLRLIERLASPDWVGEARRRFGLLPADAEWPEELRAERETLKQTLASVADLHQQHPASWLGAKIEVLRREDQSHQSVLELPLVPLGEPCEALHDFTYSYDGTQQNVIIERADGSRYGELKLASNDDNPLDEVAPVLYSSGLNIYLVHMGVIHAFSVPEKKLLWQRNTSQEPGHESISFDWNQLYKLQLRTPRQLQSDSSADDVDEAHSFEVANARQVVVRSRRGIEVLCAITGQLLWELPRFKTEEVRCDDDRMFRLGRFEPMVYSIRSGRPLLAPDWVGIKDKILNLDPIGLTVLFEEPGDGLTWEIVRYRLRGEPLASRMDAAPDRWDEEDVLQLDLHWNQPVTSDSRVGAGPPGHGVWLQSSGEVHLLEWATGRLQAVGKLELPDSNDGLVDQEKLRIAARWDRSRLYLLTDAMQNEESLDYPAAPVHGTLSVHSRDRSIPDWSTTADGLLLTQSLNRFPCLPILRQEEFSIAGFTNQRVHLTLLDKQTGKVAHEMHTPSWGVGVRGCQYQPHSQRWELFLANESVRLQIKPAPPP